MLDSSNYNGEQSTIISDNNSSILAQTILNQLTINSNRTNDEKILKDYFNNDFNDSFNPMILLSDVNHSSINNYSDDFYEAFLKPHYIINDLPFNSLSTTTTTTTTTISTIDTQDTNGTIGTIILEPDLRIHYPGLALLLGIICIIVVFGNGLTMLSICKERYLRTVTNYFVASLAFADCLVGAIVMPFSVVHEVMNKWWIFGRDWCDLWHSFDVLASTASILNLCIISLGQCMNSNMMF
ncbi:hypothetical protein BLA29_007947 [Euroglyphus maynei]|uniref:G-protein coupled receptors family 1 profile domain-containing protein n=1 Tax=Euroglyphus maynei TaxID=6958 RepID=A0A1Y3AMQ2_EURMA|nr:hypothetical protein BLA29_007947 [Euroglyphus maynei]